MGLWTTCFQVESRGMQKSLFLSMVFYLWTQLPVAANKAPIGGEKNKNSTLMDTSSEDSRTPRLLQVTGQDRKGKERKGKWFSFIVMYTCSIVTRKCRFHHNYFLKGTSFPQILSYKKYRIQHRGKVEIIFLHKFSFKLNK